MKKLLTITLSALLILSAAGCGNNAELEALKKENEELKASLNDNVSNAQTNSAANVSSTTSNVEQKKYNVNEPITVQTEYGDYNISILSASKAIELNQDGNYPIIVSFEIENLSYNYGDSSDDYSMPWDHFRSGMIVTDNEKNILKYYDILGPDEVHTPDKIPAGYKEKGAFAFFPTTSNVMPPNIQVQIFTDSTPIGIVELPVSN